MSSAGKNRLWRALGAYAVLGGIACYQLRGKVLYAVLILFAGLMAKTVIADQAGWSGTHVPDGDTAMVLNDDESAQNGADVPGREGTPPGSC